MYSHQFISQLLSMLICPIGNHLMENPVRLNCPGEHTFDRKSLNFSRGRKIRCPLCLSKATTYSTNQDMLNFSYILKKIKDVNYGKFMENLNYFFDKVVQIKNDNTLPKKFREFFQEIENKTSTTFFDDLLAHLIYEKELTISLSRLSSRKIDKETISAKIPPLQNQIKRSFVHRRVSYHLRIHAFKQPINPFSSTFRSNRLKTNDLQIDLSQAISPSEQKEITEIDFKDLDVFCTEKPIEKCPAFPLHQAVQQGDQKWLELLLKSGTPLELKDDSGFTALHQAALRNKHEMIMRLLSAEADIDAKDHKNRTPLHHAAIMNHQRILQLLIQQGADIEARDDAQATPLHHAAQWNSVEVAQLLIEAGAFIEAQDEAQLTPLHHAASWNSPQVAHLLLKAGADIHAKDEGNLKPLEYAKLASSCETLPILNL